jgi:iron complex transport system ATP-binding protein
MYFGFKDISIKYGKKQVISNVNIDFPKGKIITLIGKNGCGKSSLLKTISHAVTPCNGCVIFEDKPICKYKSKEIAKKIAYLPQVHFSPPDIDVRTLVSYGRYPHGKFGKGLTMEDKKIIDETLAFTGLTDLQFQTLSTLSGGERQRAWIAMAICQRTEILILDEPTTYLDISYQVEVLEIVQKLNRQFGTTIIMVLHDLNLAARYSDKLYVIKNCGIHSEGCPKEIITSENLYEVFEINAEIFEDKINDCPYFIPLNTTFHVGG